MATIDATIKENIALMNDLQGFDVIIICCSSQPQANYWQGRLEQGKGSILPASSLVIAVEEDWEGGAGNALGTLYAFEKASKIAEREHGLSLSESLSRNQISVGLYHTAGKGTRLAPLPASENNNKPGVKLPVTFKLRESERDVSLSILEAVIKQTSVYALSRKGRLSVFWGDQVFIPSVSVLYSPQSHIDILASLSTSPPTEVEWAERGLEKYGVVVLTEKGGAQLEKVTYETAISLLREFGRIVSVGVSLGSFSVSSLFLNLLLDEFAGELHAKRGKYDSDPHLWMPLTLSLSAYLSLMRQKGVAEVEAERHYTRIQSLLQRLNSHPEAAALSLFGGVDVGERGYWWDFGQLRLYEKNVKMMTDDTPEAECLRHFLGLSSRPSLPSSPSSLSLDAHSCLSLCQFHSGSVQRSVMAQVQAKEVKAEDCLCVNVTAPLLSAQRGSIVYNVFSDTPLSVGEREVVVGVVDDEGRQRLIRSSLDIDGGKSWEVSVCGNALSFAEHYAENETADPRQREEVAERMHRELWAKINEA